MPPVRVGVVGAGGMGSFHARALASVAGVELAGIADPFGDAASRLASELGTASTTDPFALAADATLDGVVIASPDHTHAELALAALDAGLMVLLEKPIATSLDEASTVLDAEAAFGSRRIQVGFMREYDPVHVTLRAELPSLGRIDAIRAVHRNCSPARRSVAQLVGQSMVHEFHSLRFLTGDEIETVTATGAGAGDDWFRHLLAVCRMASGAQAIVEFDDAAFGYEVTVEVLGEHGDLLTPDAVAIERRRAGGHERFLGTDWFGRFAEAYRRQDEAWIASLRTGEAVGPSTWDGWCAQAIVDATLRSLASGIPEPVARRHRPV